jgi:hypothetical protein
MDKLTTPFADELITYRVSTDDTFVHTYNDMMTDASEVDIRSPHFVRDLNWRLKRIERSSKARELLYEKELATAYKNKWYAASLFWSSVEDQERPRRGVVRARRKSAIVRKIVFQCGDLRKADREVRDAIQRRARIERDKAEKKKVPKRDRPQFVRANRDKRVPDYTEEQSGRFLSGMLGVAGGLLGAKLYRTLRKSDVLMDTLSGFIDSLRRLVLNLKQQLGQILWAVPFVAVVYYAIQHYGVFEGPGYSLLMATMTTFVGTHIWSGISEFFPDRNAHLQMGNTDALSKLLATAFTFSIFKKRMSPVVITEFCKRISMIDRMSSGWDNFLSWTMQAVEAMVNLARKMFGRERVDLFKSTAKPTYDWARRIDKVNLGESTAANIDADKLDEMVELIRMGYGYKELYRGTKMTRYVDDYLVKITNLLQPYVGSLNARNNFRFEPAACMLYGPPGVGKTLMAMPLCAAVMLLSGLLPNGSTFDDVAKNVWQKGTSEYWNSYANQICLVMDDAFQSRADSTDKENEYLTLIRMIGTWSFPLNFADLASKGKVFFGSKFVFGTTNLPCIDSEAKIVLQEPAAVVRRLNFPYVLRLTNEFKQPNGMLDYGAFEAELVRCKMYRVGLDAFPWHIWEVARHDFLTGQSSNQYFPLRQMIVEIADDLRQRSMNHEVTKDFLVDFVGGFVATNEIEPQGMKGFSADGYISPFQRYGAEILKEIEGKKSNTLARDLLICAKGLVHEVRHNWSIWKTVKWSLWIGFAGGVGYTIVKSVFTSIWHVLKRLFGRGDKKSESVEADFQSNRPVAAKRYQKEHAVFQAVDTTIATNTYCNTYKMYMKMPDSGNGFVIGQVLFIMSDLAVIPEHFTATLKTMLLNEEIKKHQLIYFKNANQSQHVFDYTVEKFFSLPRYSMADSDVEFIRFDNVRAHRNIVSNFVREGDLKYLSGVRARLDICSVDDNKKLVDKSNRIVLVLDTIKYGSNLPIMHRKLDRYFGYCAPTSVGDCGAPLSIFDNSTYSGRSVIGLHVAGSPIRSTGYSSIVTQEMIDKAIVALSIISDKFIEDLSERGVQVQSGFTLPFNVEGSFLPIGTVQKAVVICPVTSYYPTKYYASLGEYSHMPAVLSPTYRDGELIYPMNNAVSPYSTQLLFYEQEWLDQAMHVAMKPLSLLTHDSSRRIYTFEESVLGIPQEKFRSIPRGTAAGFPYVYDVRNGKKEFFGEAQEYDLTNAKALELRKRVEHVVSSARDGIRLSHVYVDFLKDELRPIKKVEAVATRLISSAPLDYTISWRMLFGAFSSAVMRHHTISGMAPGICAYSDWDILAGMLSKKGDKCFDGDFKAFDSSEQPCVHERILTYINNWYGDSPADQLARRVLWLDLVHSRHIGGLGKDQRYIYQWNKSLPSGHPFTTIVNSMYALFMLVGAYISTTGDLIGYWDHVSSVTYGDDNNTNVDDSVCEEFNQQTVAEALSEEFSMVYTAGNKSAGFVPYTTLKETTFLKRGFSMIDNLWVCPLELESFLYTHYWCKNKKLESKILVDVLETALEELSMHDSDLWTEYAPQIMELFSQMKHVPNAQCIQSQYLMLVRSRTDNWY